MTIIHKLIRAAIGEPDFTAQIESLRFHYDHHWCLPDIFKASAGDRFSVVIPERKNSHGAVCKGRYRCTRDQLVAIHKAKNIDWIIPACIAVADFVVKPDCMLAVQFHMNGEGLPLSEFPYEAQSGFRVEKSSKNIIDAGRLEFERNRIPDRFPMLLSLARSEFLTAGRIEGNFMNRLTRTLDAMAKAAHSTRYVWSDYNRKEWKSFCDSVAETPEGGMRVFSLEEDGAYNGDHAVFKRLFIGVPTGVYPYSLSGMDEASTLRLRDTLDALGIPHRV